MPELQSFNSKVETQNSLELAHNAATEPKKPQKVTIFSPFSNSDEIAREMFIRAKTMPKDSEGSASAINILNDALGLIEDEQNVNPNIKAAIHFERAKIFDDYDYVSYALRDYFEATKASDLNLKAQAFYKSGSLYDEFKEYEPALDNYLSSVAYSGEADNMNAQSKVLVKIASMFTKQFDSDNMKQYTNLAIDAAKESENDDTIARTYSQSAQNYQYLEEYKEALENYKNALAIFSRTDETFEQTAHNYEQAALVMEKLGNSAKAAKLQAKANLYYQKALQQQEQPDIAS